VAATTLGELAGFTIPAVVGAAATSAGVGQRASMVLLVLAGVGEGTVLGWAQSRMLRRELPALRAGDWVGATAAGAGVAWSIGMLPSTFSQQLLELWPPVLVAGGVLAGVLLLATIGVAQWLVLRRHLVRSGGWVLANALAWIAGLAVVFAAIAVAPPDAPLLTAVFGVAGGLGMGFTVALVTGLFLVRLLDHARPDQARWWPVTTSATTSTTWGSARSRAPERRSPSASEPAATLTSTIGGTKP